jgi:hypothetical protein
VAHEYKQAILTQPPDGSINQPVNLRLSWQDEGTAYSYRVQIFQNYLDTSVIYKDKKIKESFYIAELPENFLYTWRVSLIHDDIQDLWTDFWHFTVGNMGGVADKPFNVISGLSIYPNPSSSEINVSFNLNKSGNASLQLINALGETISNIFQNNYFDSGNHSLMINTSALPPGLYLLILRSGNETTTEKVVIIR